MTCERKGTGGWVIRIVREDDVANGVRSVRNRQDVQHGRHARDVLMVRRVDLNQRTMSGAPQQYVDRALYGHSIPPEAVVVHRLYFFVTISFLSREPDAQRHRNT